MKKDFKKYEDRNNGSPPKEGKKEKRKEGKMKEIMALLLPLCFETRSFFVASAVLKH